MILDLTSLSTIGTLQPWCKCSNPSVKVPTYIFVA